MISVIIPHLNQPGYLNSCLRSLETQTEPLAHYEVIVVDNGSASPPGLDSQQNARVRLITESTPGPGNARNAGVQNARGDILAFIDADCRAHPDWLRNGRLALGLAPNRTILGGDVRIWRDDDRRFTAIEAYESVFAYRFKLYLERHGFCGTGNLMLRRADFDQIGDFAGIQVAEDVEWGQRARAAGYSFRFVPEMIVYHPARRNLRELCSKWDRHLQHYWNMAGKDAMSKLRWIARALAVLVSPALDWTKVVASDRLDGVNARVKAVLVLIAIRVYRASKMLMLILPGKTVLNWNSRSADRRYPAKIASFARIIRSRRRHSLALAACRRFGHELAEANLFARRTTKESNRVRNFDTRAAFQSPQGRPTDRSG